MKKIVAAQEEAKKEQHRKSRQGPESASMRSQAEIRNLVQIQGSDKVVSLRTSEFVSKENLATASMECNNCYVQDRCKFHEENKSCYFKITNTFSNADELVSALRVIMVAQMNRVTHALYMESLDGGVLDQKLSIELERMNGMVMGFKDFLAQDQETVEIKAKGGGAVSAILAALGPRKRAPKPSVTVTSESVTP